MCVLVVLFHKPKQQEITGFGVAILFFISSFLVPYQGESANLLKKPSSLHRIEMYNGTLSMLKNNPWGVGHGQFIFNFIPYQMHTKMTLAEDDIVVTPHNKFLKWGAERGWLYLFVCLAWWVLLTVQFFKLKGPIELKILSRTFIFALMSQLMFQFPFENPASAFVLCFILGYILAYTNKTERPIFLGFRFCVFVFSLMFAGQAFLRRKAAGWNQGSQLI